MFLSPDELVAFTGKQRHAAQRRELDDMSVPYKIRRDGSLVVLRVAVELALRHNGMPKPAARPKLRLPA